MVLFCLVASGLLTLMGTLCAVLAFRATWRAYGGGRDMYPGLTRAWNRFRRLIGWRKSQNVAIESEGSQTSVGSLTAHRRASPYPAEAALEEQMAWLHHELEITAKDVAGLRDAATRSEDALRTKISEASTDQQLAVDETRAMAKDIATGGVPLQLAALLLISAGALVGLVPSFMAL